MNFKEAFEQALPHVYRQQHAGAHAQDREDARQWMARWSDGACQCPKCERETKKATAT